MSMEARFGHDFSGVRIHDDERAAQSAQSIGAAAYTLGSDVVLGHGYAAGTPSGDRLLAHELVHVVAGRDKHDPQARPVVGEAHDVHEQIAERLAEQVISTEGLAAETSASAEPGPIVRRSLLGGGIGGALGGIGGAVVGGLLGGPIGAIIGGVAGLVGGALIGDSLSTKERALTSPELTYAKEIFKDTIDYSLIRVTRDSMISTGTPKTLGNTIHLKSDWGHFVGDTMELTQNGRETLIHEMGHVWQYQNGGLAYIPASLWAQLKSKLSTGSVDAAYDWRTAHQAGEPWETWNPEQQARAIEEYNVRLRRSKDGTASISDLSTLSILLPYMQKVWARQGAPHFETPDLKDAPL
jgi:hypothetical protein